MSRTLLNNGTSASASAMNNNTFCSGNLYGAMYPEREGRKRYLFEKFACMYGLSASGCDNKNNSLLQESKLRLYAELTGNTGTVSFSVTNNNPNTAIHTEKRLPVQNAFIPYQWGLFLASIPGDASALEKTATYPSYNQLGLASAQDAEQLATIYRGSITLKVNNNVVINNLGTERFLHVPTTQNDGNGIVDSFNYEDVVDIVMPDIKIDGHSTNELTLSFNTQGVDFTAITPDKSKLYAVIYMEGWEAIGLGSTGFANI